MASIDDGHESSVCGSRSTTQNNATCSCDATGKCALAPLNFGCPTRCPLEGKHNLSGTCAGAARIPTTPRVCLSHRFFRQTCLMNVRLASGQNQAADFYSAAVQSVPGVVNCDSQCCFQSELLYGSVPSPFATPCPQGRKSIRRRR